MTSTPRTTDHEAELRRRLADIAATTTLDPGAWDEIQRRTSVSSPRRWHLAAVAAVVVLVVGAVVLTQRDHGAEVKTVDPTTSTAVDPRRTTTTATTVVPPQALGSPSVPGTPAESGGAGSPSGAGSGTGTGVAPRAPGSGTTEGATPVAPAPATPSPPSAPTAPDGRVPTVTLATTDYEVQATVWYDAVNGVYYMNIWLADVGYVTMWNWSETPGQNCLGGSGLDLDYADASVHRLYWGLVRADAASVHLVSTGQIMSRAQLGPEVVPGLRAWIGELPSGQLDHVEARDASGTVLHLASASSLPLDAWPDTC